MTTTLTSEAAAAGVGEAVCALFGDDGCLFDSIDDGGAGGGH